MDMPERTLKCAIIDSIAQLLGSEGMSIELLKGSEGISIALTTFQLCFAFSLIRSARFRCSLSKLSAEIT